ncbi:MAG: DUF1540 domain-containing protein [Clostridiales bacterium]|nr:DUF1540 domain-containing protein [Clostridia bacterium]MCR5353471.1 DUF1540 domain-containing protein [Clostridiales bacterium]
MARISCDVAHCEYNCGGGCRLSVISVEGSDAYAHDETLCDSYTDNSESGCVNCVPEDCACQNSEIECDAEECKYNEDFRCNADRVSIGENDACTCSETCCRTFSLK